MHECTRAELQFTIYKLLQSLENGDQCGPHVENKQPCLFSVHICLFETWLHPISHHGLELTIYPC